MIRLLKKNNSEGKRLFIVTGKGGVGKSVISYAMALAAENNHRKILIVQDDFEQSAHTSLHYYFERPIEVSYRPTRLTDKLYIIKIDPQTSMEEMFLEIYKIPEFIYRNIFKRRIAKALFNAIPGVREIFIIGKIWHEAFNKDFDLVIWDAPPSGQIPFYLTIAPLMQSAMKIGSIAKYCTTIQKDLSDPKKTGIIIVTIPERMAINEAKELYLHITKTTDMTINGLIVNKVFSLLLDQGSIQFDDLDREVEALRSDRSIPKDIADEISEKSKFLLARIKSANQKLGELDLPQTVEITQLPLLIPEKGQSQSFLIDEMAKILVDHG